MTTTRPPSIPGLVCYSVAWNRDGSIRTALYRPEKGPWTPALRKRVTSARQGSALEPERSGTPGDVAGDGANATATGRAPRGALAVELKSRQGDFGL